MKPGSRIDHRSFTARTQFVLEALRPGSHVASVRAEVRSCVRLPPNVRPLDTRDFKMKADSLIELYISQLRDLYSAETQLLKSLPETAEAAGSAKLALALLAHHEQTKGHVARLDMIFDRLGEKPTGGTCKAMQGLVREAGDITSAKGQEEVRDAGIIVAAQKIEHYEIAGYGSVCAFAKHLDRLDDIELLRATLSEEKEADALLSELAESSINVEAAH